MGKPEGPDAPYIEMQSLSHFAYPKSLVYPFWTTSRRGWIMIVFRHKILNAP
jgi:hypothetical protein